MTPFGCYRTLFGTNANAEDWLRFHFALALTGLTGTAITVGAAAFADGASLFH